MVESVTTDATGAVYVTGSYSGTTDFDPQVIRADGSDIKTATATQDFFVAKYAAGGQLSWVYTVNGAAKTVGRSLDLDASGNVLVTGQFEGSISVGNSSFTSRGLTDVFLLKLTGSGGLVWARAFGAAESDMPASIQVDSKGNTYVFSNRFTKFDDLVKYDSRGNQLWFRTIANNTLGPGGLALDASDNPVLVGSFQGTVDFDPSSKTYYESSAYAAAYVLKLNASGAFSSVATFKPVGAGHNFGTAIAIDGQGNLIVGGMYGGTIDFDPKATVRTVTGSGAYVAKLNRQGALVSLASFDKVGTVSSSLVLADLEVDSAGGVWASGTIVKASTASDPIVYDFASGPSEALVSVTATTGFIAHLSSGLAFDSVDVLGADTNAYIRDTAVAADGSLIVVGNFSGSVDFDTDPLLSSTLSPTGSRAGFVARYRRV